MCLSGMPKNVRKFFLSELGEVNEFLIEKVSNVLIML